MVKVSIHPDIEYKDIISDYVNYFKLWKEDGVLSGYLGSDGQWESNSKLCNSFVFKLHIRIPIEPQWNRKVPQALRKSDNYLVYCQHWCNLNEYQIIAIMSPNAHKKAKSSYLSELERRAEEFQNLI